MKNKKRTVSAIAAALTFVILLVSCGSSAGSENKTHNVESIIKAYDANQYTVQRYDENMIADISSKLALKSGIKSITHIIKVKTSENDENEWTYVYEFTSSEDSADFEENRVEYCKTIDNGACVRFGNIVVYGNSDVISKLE